MAVDVEALQRRVSDLEAQLRIANQDLQRARSQATSPESERAGDAPNTALEPADLPLSLEEYQRYGRQLIMPEMGVATQLRLKTSSVLLIGAGGLGCPAAAYLTGAGVGTLGIVDGDIVEASNLHRQILHATAKIGSYKVESVRDYVQSLNPLVKCKTYTEHLSPAIAFSIMAEYDLVLDCTDTPQSRYLVSDAAVLSGKPVIFASASRTEGQLIVLNHPVAAPGEQGGPCYRCVYPRPPLTETVMTCGGGGILGPVVGIMGVLQALEAIKILAGGVQGSPSMHVFSGFPTPSLRTFKLKGRRKDCRTCSGLVTVSVNLLETDQYSQLCGASAPVDVLRSDERMKPMELARTLESDTANALVIDVREKPHFDVFHLPGSINLPFSMLNITQDCSDDQTLDRRLAEASSIHVICRLGNDSQHAVQKLKKLGLDRGGQREISDVEGGWQAWRRDVRGNWPDI